MKAKLPILVLISGHGSNLQAIIDASQKDLSVDIVAVISDQADAYGLVRATHANIPTAIVSRKDYPSREAFDQALIRVIDRYQPKLIVLAGFMRILGGEFVRRYLGRLINIHPALLPKHKGLNTHEKVLAEKDSVHGITVHFVTEEMDSGPIICQATLPVLPTDTIDTLTARVHQLEHQVYPRVISWFAAGRLELKDNTVYFDQEALPISGAQVNVTPK